MPQQKFRWRTIQEYEVHFLGDERVDIDGNVNETSFNPFESIGDSQQNQGRIYEANVDRNHLGKVRKLRIGRQSYTRDSWLLYDGLSAILALSHSTKVVVLAGIPVHFYEETPGNDTLGGLSVDYLPSRSSKLSLDFLSVKDERESRDGISDQNDQLVSVQYSQRFFDRDSRALVRYRWINDLPRDFKIHSANRNVVGGLEFELSYFRQFRSQKELSDEFSSYYDIIGESLPHQTANIKIRKQFGDDYLLDVVYFQKSLLEDEEETAFNREYSRTSAVFAIENLMAYGLDFSINAETWDSDTYSGNTGGFDIEYQTERSRRSTKVSLGHYFTLYKYDYYLELGERTQVTTTDLKTKVPFGMNYNLTARYLIEQSIEDYQKVEIGIQYLF